MFEVIDSSYRFEWEKGRYPQFRVGDDDRQAV